MVNGWSRPSGTCLFIKPCDYSGIFNNKALKVLINNNFTFVKIVFGISVI